MEVRPRGIADRSLRSVRAEPWCPNTTDAPDCLTQNQVDAAKKLYSSPVDAQGVRYSPGGTLPYGSELRWVVSGGPPGGGNFDR